MKTIEVKLGDRSYPIYLGKGTLSEIGSLLRLRSESAQVVIVTNPTVAGYYQDTVRESLEPRHSVAHTTVATMLTRMETDGYVAHRVEGRANIYRPLIGRADTGLSMVSDLADRFFRGDRAQMMTHLLAGAEITPDELARLKKLVRDKESELRNGQ